MKGSIRVLAVLALVVAAVEVPDRLVLAQSQAQAPEQAPGAGASRGAASNRLYIVQMAEAPVVSYDGGVAALPGTRPPPGAED